MTTLPSECRITYEYIPDAWDAKVFLKYGGFTVVFLNYNKARYIEQSVAFALGQEFPMLEIFFMDDASTDGSGETMEQLVRAYQGPHKVTVVRNLKNRRITGQWNTVARLATGNWLGMFCADDVAEPDRVAQAAEIVARFPSVRGFCTSGVAVDSENPSVVVGDVAEGFSGLLEERGTLSPWDLIGHSTPIIGATAFWHISNFETPLPYGPLDDVLLRWVVYARNHGRSDSVWVADMTRSTIRYSVGAGISNEFLVRAGTRLNRRELWRRNTEAKRRFAKLMVQTLTAVRQYIRDFPLPEMVLHAVDAALLKERIVAGDTGSRLLLLPSLLRTVAFGGEGWRSLVRLYVKRLLAEFFGLAASSYCMALIKRGAWSGRVGDPTEEAQ